jgi:hypothetical protein
MGAKEALGLAQADEVGLDGPLGSVQRTQMPLEGADKGTPGGLVNEPKR